MASRADKDKGLVFNIQKYSMNDGSGIRTIVFFKGCPLRCQWCSNPESQRLMPEVIRVKDECINCGKCKLLLNKSKKEGKKPDYAEISEACPAECWTLKGEWMSIQDIYEVVAQDREFYLTSGGGITFSGGEVLTQWKFASKLAKTLKDNYFDLASETTGYAKYEHAYEVLKHCDTVLYDLKHMDSEMHKKYIGVPNELILENARRLREDGVNLIYRYPVIGGINNTIENVDATIKFAKETNVPEIHLLPYHRFGESKYEKLGMEYVCDAYTPSDEEMNSYKERIEAAGLKSIIGG